MKGPAESGQICSVGRRIYGQHPTPPEVRKEGPHVSLSREDPPVHVLPCIPASNDQLGASTTLAEGFGACRQARR